MNIHPAHRRLAAALLLAAAPFPLTPALAQDAQQPAEAEAQDADPATDEAPAEAEEPRVVTVAPPAPAAQPAGAAEPPAAARRTPARTAAPAPAPRRATPPPPPRVAASVPAAGLPVAASPSPAPATIEPAAPLPAPTSDFPPPPAATSDAAAADPTPAADAETSGENNGPLLLLGALALGGAVAAFLIARKRRRTSVHHHHSRYAEAAAAAQPEPIAAAPLAAAPLTSAPVAAAAAPAAPALRPPPAAAADAPEKRPWLQLLMQPVRAGVADEAARVEFELRVENNGTAPAEDVRISTFMLAAGSPQESQLEQSLVEHPSEARLPDPIHPGDTRRIAASVALPRADLGDAVLPVVVADARYTLPDGSEGRTFASYAVGLPWEGDLAHFDVHSPSGLHEGVEARLRARPTQV